MPRRRGSDTVRGDVVEKLAEAIETTSKIAKDEKNEPSLRARYYQVLGYLSQTVDGLLRNVDLSESAKELAELKEIVVQLQKRTPRDAPTSPGAKG